MSQNIIYSASVMFHTLFRWILLADLSRIDIKTDITVRMKKAKGLDESAKSRKSAVDEKNRKAVDTSEF